MGSFSSFAGAVNNLVWGAPMLILLVGTHVFLTVRTRGIQRRLGRALRLSVARDDGAEGDISQFGALATALAATLGTGNIVGVATAIALGGPGAVLWCWLTGIFGIATKYGEALLAVKYRVRTSDGTMLGGPMYALERGLRLKGLAAAFAVFAALASFGIGSSTQANSLTGMVAAQFGVAPWVSSLVVAALVGLVILGGVKSIARVCTLLVPFMAVFYLAGCLFLLALNARYIGAAVALICRSAFSARAVGGGFAASTVMTAARYGVARGLFSNESGLGSAPIAAAAARTRNPVRQALVSMTGTFWDTVVVCAVTGLTLVSSIARSPETYYVGGSLLEGGALTSAVFAQIRTAGPIILTVGLACFVFSTMVGWSYYGERCVEYLFGKAAILPYKAVYVAAAFFGGVASLGVVWNLADTLNGLMAIPNLISLLGLSGVIASETRRYLWSGGEGLDTASEETPPLR
ncbi:MAG: sodium:alanine symporter family protein [Oscillospiraceae bacterium]|jgi:AGCS family alanine or glycine:cation symporter|nr:sodium:alanine symporter family protein [Oscillospiraceae bacterium]